MKQNWERQKKHGKRKQRWWKWLQWNEIANLNSLKSFEFEPKTNIEDMNSIRSDDEEEGAEYKVKRQVTLSSVSLVQRQPLANFLQNRCQACNFIKKELQIYGIFKYTFFHRTSVLWWLLMEVNSVN